MKDLSDEWAAINLKVWSGQPLRRLNCDL